MTFKIVGEPPRLEAPSKLTSADFDAIARAIRTKPLRARKIGYVAARRAERDEVVETWWNGSETINTARAGDYIVTNLLPHRHTLLDNNGLPNVYVIAAPTFARLYEVTTESSPLGVIYRPKGEIVYALPLPGGFDIAAPWGERQTGKAGYLLLIGDEVTGIGAEAFIATYETVRN